MANVIKFEDLPVEALTEVAKETFEEALWATEKALAKQLEFGRVMLIVKSKLPYGEWGNWVRETFQDQMSLRNIQFHMKAHQEVAKNPSLLECANSLDEILSLTEKPRKPSVGVIEVVAEVAEDKPVVATVEPVTTNPSRLPRHAGEHNESKVFAIGKADVAITQLKGIPAKNNFRDAALDHVQAWIESQKKETTQLIQFATNALNRLTFQNRGEAICKQIVSMTREEREMVYATVEQMLKKKPSQLGS